MHPLDWMGNHGFILLIGYYVFSSAVGALPSPDDKSGTGYKFLFGFMHALAANALRIPQVRNFVEPTQTPKEP